MTKYIKADGVMRACFDSFVKTNNQAYREIFALIEAVPAADVVEVVRCEECDNWNPMTHGCVRNPCIKPWWEDDYCSYWEEKEDE